jgi:hypothetical protein
MRSAGDAPEFTKPSTAEMRCDCKVQKCFRRLNSVRKPVGAPVKQKPPGITLRGCAPLMLEHMHDCLLGNLTWSFGNRARSGGEHCAAMRKSSPCTNSLHCSEGVSSRQIARRTSSSKGASGMSKDPRTPPLFFIAVRTSSSDSSLHPRHAQHKLVVSMTHAYKHAQLRSSNLDHA